ncbi:MAG: GntR family transcriptional regulator [Clostridia bacterium]|nr:GntR family transcriptional regulator [Clostridia bacterium]
MDYIFDNERPIYVQLVEKLRIEIVSGKLKNGERIPSVRELALTTKVNPNTMQKALAELENEGLIYTERTNGKFVTDNKELIEKIKRKLAEEKVNNYIKDMKNIGITYDQSIQYLQELGRKECE